MHISQRDAAAVIASLERIDEERQRILDILFPETDDAMPAPGCTHAEVLDLSTMGEDRFQCTACGAEFPHHPRTTNPEE